MTGRNDRKGTERMMDRVAPPGQIAADYRRRADRGYRRADELAAAGFPESAEAIRRRADGEQATAADYDRIANRTATDR